MNYRNATDSIWIKSLCKENITLARVMEIYNKLLLLYFHFNQKYY